MRLHVILQIAKFGQLLCRPRMPRLCFRDDSLVDFAYQQSDRITNASLRPGRISSHRKLSHQTNYLPKCTQEAMTNVGSCNNCSTPTRFERTWSERATVQPDSSASAPTVNYGTAVLTIDVAANSHKPALQSLNCLNLTTCRTESTKDYQALSSSSPEASNLLLTLDPASKVSQSIRSYRKDVGLTTSESYSYSRILSPLNEEEILSSGNPHLIRPQHSTTTISGHDIA
ncbi:hypothetical protein GJ496_004486 [Pomphorhynchus laevis]|nr:hypothetical protein GJ496_004486 [Pomphorhynchus laevis]